MQTYRKLILGKSGSGKSFLAKQLLKKCDKNYFIYDTLGEYTDHGILFTDYEQLESYWLSHTDKFKIVYQPLLPKDEFNYIASMVYSVGDCVFLIEELDTFCSPYEFSVEFANIIQRGRHRNIDFIGISQRPYGINRTISSQCKEIITFQQSEPRDITFLSMYIGKNVEAVRDLGQYEYLYWADNKCSIVKPSGVAHALDRAEDEQTEKELTKDHDFDISISSDENIENQENQENQEGD